MGIMGPPGPSGAGGVASVVLDGRMLEHKHSGGDHHHRRNASKEEQGKDKPQPKLNTAARAHASRDLKPPLTPPRAIGVSLAPVADSEFSEAQRRMSITQGHHPSPLNPSRPSIAQGAGAPAGQVLHQRAGLAQMAPPPLLVPPGNSVSGASTVSRSGQQPVQQQQLLAEGKSIQGIHAHAAQHALAAGMHAYAAAAGVSDREGSGGVFVDERIAYYHEINETDSLCATPPTLRLAGLGDVGPLGPLSPTPLSPSILTLCGRLEADMGLLRVSNEDPGPLWDSYGALPDMRDCRSPSQLGHSS